ncbi:MAG TPA: serine hydrolase domain-containing protein [Pyrinomonadaceae bacterium]|nr:serine hydrolase domain-containing protein [Pyrinomonadaceae bacterium]
MIIKPAFFVVTCTALLALTQTATPQSATAKKIDDLIQPVAQSGRFSGIVIASQNGTIIYEKAFGMANAELKVPNTTGSRIGIASITKPMTGIILTRLIEEQKLTLDDKLSKFIPDFPNGDKITIAMLSQHRSGIPHRVMPEVEEAATYTSVQMIEKVKQAKLAFEPGTGDLYSSGGYATLARVLEIVSGQTYSQLLQKYVFDPGQMSDSVDWNGPTVIERRTQEYVCDAAGYTNAAAKDYSFLVGAGSVVSTASDLYKFGNALIDGKFGPNSKTSFVRNGIVRSSGNTNGHRSYFEIKEDKSYGLVVLSNMACGSFDFVQRGVTDILQGKEPTAKTLVVPKFAPNANKDLNEFTGRYKMRNTGSETNILIRDGNLFANDIKLYSVKPDCFFDFKYFGDACFVRDAAGKITSIRWSGLTFELMWDRQ